MPPSRRRLLADLPVFRAPTVCSATVCAKCGEECSGVLDSRVVHGAIRRRRVCHHCSHRWTTWETASDLWEIANLDARVRRLKPEQFAAVKGMIDYFLGDRTPAPDDTKED